MSVDVPIPGLRTACELNKHEHWKVRYRRSVQQKGVVTLVLRRTVTAQMMAVAPIAVTFVRIAPSEGLDVGDNLNSSMKFIRDAVAELLGIDDSDPRVEWRYEQRRGPWGIRIRIESVQREGASHAS